MASDGPGAPFRFAVALSFPGEYREFLRQVDRALCEKLEPHRVFFDERFEAEIAGFDGDTLLQRIYHDQSELIVVFLCREYEEKEWCLHVEWRAVRDLIKRRRGADVLPLRFDRSEIPGVYSIDICPDISSRSPGEVADLIWRRYEIRHGETPAPPIRLGPLHLVPSLPDQYVAREGLIAAIRHSLLHARKARLGLVGTAASGEVGGIVGMGGVGKTVLASALAQDQEIRECFPGGVFWISLGRENVNLLNRQIQLARMLGQPNPSYLDEQDARAGLETLCRGSRCLIVLDDVWDVAHVHAFDVLDPGSCLLITTRNGDIVRGLGAESFEIDVLQEMESLSLLAQWARCKVEDLPETAREVARECGHLPLALAIVGSLAGDRSDNWDYLLHKLRQADLRKLGYPFPQTSYPYANLFIALDVSLVALTEEERRLYIDLAVFPEDTFIPEKTLQTFWAPAGYDELDTRRLLQRLAMRSLLRLRGDGSILLHDLLRDYVCLKCQDPVGAQLRLLESYRTRCPQGWHAAPRDGYFFEHAAFHFIAAGRRAEWRETLLDWRWLKAKLAAADVSSLLADFSTFEPGTDEPLDALRDALRKSAHVLARDADQLPSQLHGRLLEDSHEEIRRLLAHVSENWQDSWLEPYWRCLASSDSLLSTLVGHTRPICRLAMSSDGRQAASGSMQASCAPGMGEDGGRVRVWDLATGRQSAALDSESYLIKKLFVAGAASTVAALGFHLVPMPDGGGRSSAPLLEIWNLDEPTKAARITGDSPWMRESTRSLHLHGARAVALEAGCLSVFDLRDGSPIHRISNPLLPQTLKSVAMSSTGDRLLMVDGDYRLRLWDLRAGSELRTRQAGATGEVSVHSAEDLGAGVLAIAKSYYPYEAELTAYDFRALEPRAILEDGHQCCVLALASLPDGKYCVFGARVSDPTIPGSEADFDIRVWDHETGKLRWRLPGHQGRVTALAVTERGDLAVSGSEDRTLIGWDMREGVALARLRGHTAPVNDAVISPDGRRALSGSSDRTLKLWDLESLTKPREEAESREAHTAAVNAVAAAGDGSFAVSGSADTAVWIWSLRDGKVLRKLGHHDTYVNAVAVDGRGDLIVSAGRCGDIRVWDARNGSLLKTISLPEGSWHLDKYVNSLALSEDVLLCGLAQGTVCGVDMQSGSVLYEVNAARHVNSVAISREAGRFLSGGDGSWSGREGDPWPLRVWDLGSGEEIMALDGHTGPINSVAITGDGGLAVSGSSDRLVKVWDLRKGELLYTLGDHPDDVKAVAIMPDGRFAMAGSHSGLITVWEMATGRVVARFTGDAFIGALAGLNDNRTLVAGDGLGKLYCLRLKEAGDS